MNLYRRYSLFVGLLLFFALCLVPSGEAQTPTSVPSQIGLTWPAQVAGGGSLGAFDARGLRYFSVSWVVSGSVSCTVTLDGASTLGGSFTTGSIMSSQSCSSSGTFTTTSATESVQGQLTPTITGSGSVTFTLQGYALNPGTAGSSSASIISPVDGSGYVEVNCKTGCAAGSGGASAADESTFTQGTSTLTPIGGLYSTSITPLISGQVGVAQLTVDRNLFVNVNKWAGTQLGAPSNYGTSPGAVAVFGVNAFVTNTPNVVVTTLPSIPAGSSNIGAFNVFGHLGAAVDAAAGATAAANSFQTGGVYNTAPPSPSNGQQEPLQLDPSANLKVQQGAAPSDLTASGTVIATGQNVSIATNGTGNVIFNVTGTWVGTLQPQVQLPDLSWVNATAFPILPGGTGVSTITANGQFEILPAGFKAVRLFSTGTWTSGAATVNFNASVANSTLAVRQLTAANLQAQVTPALSSGALIAGQQAVTATATSLPSTTLTRPACLVALSSNSLTVYLGPSGVTSSNGFPLLPGASLCNLSVSNLNQIFVIASSTGSSVTWSAQ
jgi:hypothetical protein